MKRANALSLFAVTALLVAAPAAVALAGTATPQPAPQLAGYASFDLTTGQSWKLEPGVGYNVGPKDRHRLRADTALHLISVFCPPLEGHEQHDADGALMASGPVPPGPAGY